MSKHLNLSTEFYGLKLYDSFEKTSSRSSDIVHTFILPVVAFFGVCTSALSIIVLINTKLSNNIHLYMLIGSSIDLAFLLTKVFVFIFRCGAFCTFSFSYEARLYELYIYNFVGYLFSKFKALVDMSVSIDRILSFSNKKTPRKNERLFFGLRCLLLFILAAIVLIPDQIISRVVNPFGVLVKSEPPTVNNNYTIWHYQLLYRKDVRNEWNESGLKAFLSVLKFINGPVLFFSMIVVNLVVVNKFKRHLNNKDKLKTGKTHNKLITFISNRL